LTLRLSIASNPRLPVGRIKNEKELRGNGENRPPIGVNVDLICADAAEFLFPSNVGGVLSTLTLSIIPGAGRVVHECCRALAPGRWFVNLDMAWPRWCPRWWRHVLFFLRAYGVTKDVLRRRAWDDIYAAMKAQLVHVSRKKYWLGFFYLACGTRQREPD
jgi:demethylmenaquinone methyltransferase/2-methoxy-6-polyprenyl-1,4-benzoquinol methylase